MREVTQTESSIVLQKVKLLSIIVKQIDKQWKSSQNKKPVIKFIEKKNFLIHYNRV